MFSSVMPGEFMSGYMKGQIQFPSWLGKYSKQNKMDRLLQEVQIHTRLSANLTKQALNRDFIQPLRQAYFFAPFISGDPNNFWLIHAKRVSRIFFSKLLK